MLVHNQRRRRFVFSGVLLLLCLCATTTQCWGKDGYQNKAITTNSTKNLAKQAIYLEADRVDINDKEKISTYQGNVKLSHGNITILADKIIAKKNKNGLGKLLATGNPVKLNRTQTDEQKEIRGEALEIEYDTEKERVKLKNNAKLWQSNDQFTGNLIIYNVAMETVTANKGNEKNGRVRVVIHPDNTSTQNNTSENNK